MSVSLEYWSCSSEYCLDDENPASLVLMEIEGIIIDEYTMVDVRVWNAMKRILQTYPLDPSRRKPNALKEFGYRDIIIVGDLCQLPPASGLAPIVHLPDYQQRFEFCVLR